MRPSRDAAFCTPSIIQVEALQINAWRGFIRKWANRNKSPQPGHTLNHGVGVHLERRIVLRGARVCEAHAEDCQ